jgi:DNA-binding response OmpR family regulator/class 3 adenylate cyclase
MVVKTETDLSTTASTVLIVDDNAENRLLLSSQLRMEGYTILQAGGGVEGLQMAHDHDPDIILLDVMMPDMNGFEVCTKIKDDPKTHLIPVIMVTALREVQYRIEGIGSGADEYLSRPHVREELLVRVRTLIQLKRARVKLQEERNRLQLLYNIGRAISTQLDLESTIAEIITQTQTALGATKGNIMLLDDDGNVTIKFLIRAGGKVEISEYVTQDVMTRGLGGWLVKNNRGDIISNISEDERWVTLPDDEQDYGSAIGVPLSKWNRLVGILILNHPEADYFTHEHLLLLEAIAAQATTAIENADLFTEVSEERRKLEAILAQSTDAIITTDEELYVSLVNQAAEHLFEIDGDSLRDQFIYEVPQLKILLPLFKQTDIRVEPQEIVLVNGKTLYVSISPIQGVGYAVLMQDVTEIKRIEEIKLEQERREKQRVKETFSRYMGPRLVDHVLSHEPGLLSRRERRQAVVMFADLRNWTGGMIMKLAPDEAIQQLNEFFTAMMDIAIDNDGTVFELTADEILVGFNVPFDQQDAPFLAIKTAVLMHHRFDHLRQRWYERLGTDVGLGIGIDIGDVVVGNVGAESRMTFRMVGGAINTAHRLVDIAEDGHIVVSKGVIQALNSEVHQEDLEQLAQFDTIGPLSLKGISEPQILYRAKMPRTRLEKNAQPAP